MKSHVNVTDNDILERAEKEARERDEYVEIGRWKDEDTAQKVIDAELANPKTLKKIETCKRKAGQGAPDDLKLTGQFGPNGAASLGTVANSNGRLAPSNNTYIIILRFVPNHPKKFVVYYRIFNRNAVTEAAVDGKVGSDDGRGGADL